jgi:hypothetical protein
VRHDLVVEFARVKELELYRRGERWAFTVLEEPAARKCGKLNQIAGDASFDEAERALIELVKAGYGFAPTPEWTEVESEWWVAVLGPDSS